VFGRPSDEQRRAVLTDAFGSLNFTSREIEQLVKATGPQAGCKRAASGPQAGREYSFTFSDLMQRLLPAIVLDAYPSRPVTGARAVEVAASILPTPPFKEQIT
jgi:hypothetical protein